MQCVYIFRRLCEIRWRGCRCLKTAIDIPVTKVRAATTVIHMQVTTLYIPLQLPSQLPNNNHGLYISLFPLCSVGMVITHHLQDSNFSLSHGASTIADQKKLPPPRLATSLSRRVLQQGLGKTCACALTCFLSLEFSIALILVVVFTVRNDMSNRPPTEETRKLRTSFYIYSDVEY